MSNDLKEGKIVVTYFDLNKNLSSEDMALRDAAHKFAAEVMRPISKELDQMSAEDAIGPDSPIWGFLKKAYELNYHRILLPGEAGLGLTPLQIHLVQEELGWGSFGLAALLGGVGLPFYFAAMSGNKGLIAQFTEPFLCLHDASLIGCWAVTEPDHGSDTAAFKEDFFNVSGFLGNVRAQLDGEEWVISGQKAAWVSVAPIATHAVVHVQVDPSRGLNGMGLCIIPLNLRGVSRGKPLRKMGQRELCQGELFFEGVRVPKNYMVFGPDEYDFAKEVILATVNADMSVWSTGLARAAFEEALKYAKERVQGRKMIIEHYSVRQKLFNMFSKVETCRALSRAVCEFNYHNPIPFVEYSIAAKIACTKLCFEVASDAVQLLGGNGLAQEYLTEKLFRDARTSLIMDGCNDALSATGGAFLAEFYPRCR
ncbi:MAG: acyl-CoA dehydrogenase family protein [Candidatus Methanomethyliaceae archaeon]